MGRIDGDMAAPANRGWLTGTLPILFRLTAVLLLVSLVAGLAHELLHAHRPPDIAESYLAEAHRLFRAGQYEEAVRRLRVAAEISQEEAASYMLAEAEAKLREGRLP